MAALPNFKFGCDPELFVYNRVDNKMVPAHDLIPGDKRNPHKVPHGAIQVDGLAVEFNIDPVDTPEDWEKNISYVMGELKDALPKGHDLVVSPTCIFDKEVYAALPPKALEMGCDPDFDAYTGKENVRPAPVGTMRTAAGHVHIGWTEGADIHDPDHFADCIEVVKQLDYYLGLTSLLWDKDQKRRLMYGKAGAFRAKPYGVEYRVISNRWLASPVLRRFVYQAANAAVTDLFTQRCVLRMTMKDHGLDPVKYLNITDVNKRANTPEYDIFRWQNASLFTGNGEGVITYCDLKTEGYLSNLARQLDPTFALANPIVEEAPKPAVRKGVRRIPPMFIEVNPQVWVRGGG